MTTPTVPIVCRSLTKHFAARTVLHDLSFDVPPATVTGFVGANGAGKTTTMRVILGLAQPSAGEARINGRLYRELRHPRRAG